MSKSLKFKLGINIIEAKKEVQKFVASANKSMQGLKTEIKLDSAAVKSATNKIDKAVKDTEESLKRHNKSVERMRKESLGRIERSEIQSGASHIQSRRKYMQRLEEIIQTSNQRSLEDTRRMIRLIEVEYTKVNRMELAGARTGKGYTDISDRTRDMSRQVNVMFNVQQAIEDFSFAGMRGASNNLAAMAATLGGPAGIIAMLGLAGYSIYNIGNDMGWFGKKVEETNKSLRDQISHVKELRDAQRGRRDAFATSSSLDSPDALRREMVNLATIRRQFMEAERDAARMNNFERSIRDQSGSSFTDDLGDYARRQKEINRLLDEHKDIVGNINAKEFMDNIDVYLKEITESSKDAGNELEKRRNELYDIRNQVDRLKRTFDLDNSIRRLERSFDTLRLTGVDEKSLPLAKKFMEQAEKTHNDRLETIMEEVSQRKFNIALMEAELASEADILKAKEDLKKYLEDQKALLEESSKPAKDLAESLSVSFSLASDVAAQTDRLAQSTERAAKAAWERVKALKAEKQSGQFSFESTVFGAQNTILDKQAEEALEQRRNMLGSQDNYLKRDEMMVKFMFGDNERTRKLIQERAKVISKQYEYALKSIEDTVDWQRRVRANTLLDERIDVLKDRSAGQAKGGDFKGSIESLSEVQNLLLGAMGNAGTSTEMTAFLNRAKKIQDEIDKMHDRNIQRETERADKAQQMADQARELRDDAVKTKEAIESIDPNANGAMDRLLEMQRILEKMRTDAEAMEALFEAQQNVPVAMSSPLPNFMAGNAGRPGGMSNTNVTNITVGSVNTAATSANSLATDIYSKAKRQGIMMS